MAWTRGTYMGRVREFADATGSDRWSDALVRGVLASVHRQGWHRLLDAAPALRLATRTVTTDANGQIALSALADGTGDTATTVRRIHAITDGARLAWAEVAFQDVPFGTLGVTDPARVWYQRGDAVQLLPVEANAARVVTVSTLPAMVDALADDASTVVWPDGHESVLAWRAAAHLLMKGGAESDAAGQLEAMARDAEATMLAQVARLGAMPTRWAFSDDAAMWGL